MNICISIGHGKSAKGGYDSGGQNTILHCRRSSWAFTLRR